MKLLFVYFLQRLCPCIFLSILLFERPQSSLRVRDLVPHPYKTAGGPVIEFVSFFFLDTRRKYREPNVRKDFSILVHS
jgi:hypothetical protein